MDPSSVRGWISQSHLASISGEHPVRINEYEHDMKCLSECCAPFFNPASIRLTIAARDMRSWQAHNPSMRRFILRKQAQTPPSVPVITEPWLKFVGLYKNTEMIKMLSDISTVINISNPLQAAQGLLNMSYPLLKSNKIQ